MNLLKECSKLLFGTEHTEFTHLACFRAGLVCWEMLPLSGWVDGGEYGGETLGIINNKETLKKRPTGEMEPLS